MDAFVVVLCGLAAALAWGFADFLAAKASRIVGPATSVIAVSAVGLVLFMPFYFLSGHHLILHHDAWYAAGAGLALGVGLIAFFQALEAGPVSLVSPLSSAYPLVTTLLVLLLLHESLSARQLVGILVVMLGVMAASELLSVKKGERRLGRGPALALFVAVAWGAAYTFMAQALKTMDWQMLSLVQLVFVAIACTLLAPSVKGDERVFRRVNLRSFVNPFILGTGFLQMFGMVVVNIGIERSPSSAPVVAAVSACYPVLTILLALKHFKEELKFIPLAGAVLTIVGVVVLSLG